MTIPLTELGVTNSRLGTPMYQIMDAFTHREIARELRQLVSGPTAIMVNPETGEGVDIELMLRFFARADEEERLADYLEAKIAKIGA